MRHSTDFHREIRHARYRRHWSRGTPGALLACILAGGALGLGAGTWNRVEAPAATFASDGTGTGAASSDRMALYAGDTVSARFGFCHSGGGRDCVVDGDTFRLNGERIRIADIDAPETHPPRCGEEARLGDAATQRLHALLNAGPVTLEIADRDTDRYGRKLRVVTRGGRSLGDQLVDEGLARPWTGRRRPWC